MKKLIFLLFILITALFFDVFSHELYHYYKHKDYAKGIYFNTNELTAYTEINFPDYKTRLLYNDNLKNDEENNANLFGKFVASIYLIFVLFNFIRK